MTADSTSNQRPPTPRELLRGARPVPARTLRCSDCGTTVVALVGDRAVCVCGFDFGEVQQ